MSTIELVMVSKSYGSTTVVNNVNLQITEGEFVTLLGPSGSGKTTILSMVSGFTQPGVGKS